MYGEPKFNPLELTPLVYNKQQKLNNGVTQRRMLSRYHTPKSTLKKKLPKPLSPIGEDYPLSGLYTPLPLKNNNNNYPLKEEPSKGLSPIWEDYPLSKLDLTPLPRSKKRGSRFNRRKSPVLPVKTKLDKTPVLPVKTILDETPDLHQNIFAKPFDNKKKNPANWDENLNQLLLTPILENAKDKRGDGSGTIIYKNNKQVPSIYTSQCNDPMLIEVLKENKILPDNFKNELICDKNIYNIGFFIGEGTYNIVHEIYKKNIDDTKSPPLVLRETIEYDNATIIHNELSGLFVQTYLSNKHELATNKDDDDETNGYQRICKVYDFGTFINKDNKTGVYAILEQLVDFHSFIIFISDNDNKEYFDKIFKSNADFVLNMKHIIFDILLAFEYIHSRLYAHLDIKINNIGLTNLVRTKEKIGSEYKFFYEKINKDTFIRAKLFDFGTSKIFDNYNSPLPYNYWLDLNHNYHPPETLYLQHSIVLISSDIYMFGEMIYNSFLGENAYKWKTNIYTDKTEIIDYFIKELKEFLGDNKLNILFPIKRFSEENKSMHEEITEHVSDHQKEWDILMTHKFQEFNLYQFSIQNGTYKNYKNYLPYVIHDLENEIKILDKDVEKIDKKWKYFMSKSIKTLFPVRGKILEEKQKKKIEDINITKEDIRAQIDENLKKIEETNTKIEENNTKIEDIKKVLNEYKKEAETIKAQPLIDEIIKKRKSATVIITDSTFFNEVKTYFRKKRERERQTSKYKLDGGKRRTKSHRFYKKKYTTTRKKNNHKRKTKSHQLSKNKRNNTRKKNNKKSK